MKQGIQWMQDKIYEAGSKRGAKKKKSYKNAETQKQDESESVGIDSLEETTIEQEEEIT